MLSWENKGQLWPPLGTVTVHIWLSCLCLWLVSLSFAQCTAQVGCVGEWQRVRSYWIPLSLCGLDLCSLHLTLLLSYRVCVPQASESGTFVLVVTGLRFLLVHPTI